MGEQARLEQGRSPRLRELGLSEPFLERVKMLGCVTRGVVEGVGLVAPPTTVAEEVGQPKVDRPVAQPLVEAAAVRDLVSIPLLLVGMAEVDRGPIWVALRSMAAVAEPGVK